MTWHVGYEPTLRRRRRSRSFGLFGLGGSADVGGRNPARALPWLDMLYVHGVNLLKSTALGLADEEVNDNGSSERAGSKNVAVLEVNGAGDEWGEEGNQKVPCPVGGGCNSHAGGAVACWVEFTHNRPDDRSPGGCETNNEEAGKDNQGGTGLGSGRRIGLVERVVSDGSKNHKADEHPDATSNQRLAATKVLDNVETNDGNTKVDTGHNHLGDVAVVQTSRRENGVAIVENEVGTGELLQRLQDNTKNGAVKHTRTSEDLKDTSLSGSLFFIELVLHVGDFFSDEAVVVGDTIQLDHGTLGFFDTAHAVGVTRRLGQEENTNTEDQRPGETNSHGDAPCGGGVHAFSTVVDAGSDEDTKGDKQLESTVKSEGVYLVGRQRTYLTMAPRT